MTRSMQVGSGGGIAAEGEDIEVWTLISQAAPARIEQDGVITLIHALKAFDSARSRFSFARLWPEATLMNLVDDSLSADLARDGRLTGAMTDRFLTLGRYAVSTGADAILFTCSAFGPCIEAVAREHAPMPVLKPSEAMVEQAAARGHRIGLLSTFPPTLVSMPRGISALARGRAETGGGRHGGAGPRRPRRTRSPGRGSLARLARLRPDRARAIQHGTRPPRWSPRRRGLPVLTTPDSAVLKLKAVARRSGA